MNYNQFFFYLLIAVLSYQCSSSKNIQFVDGQCYGKCVIPDDLVVHYDEYAIYTGNESEEDVDLEVKEIILEEKSEKWVKKKADKNCLSADPDDCFVWCLVEVPEKKEVLMILIDTSQSKNYRLKRIERDVLHENGVYMDWKPVLYKKDLTKAVKGQIQNALKEKGFLEKEINYKFDASTKKSLMNFQRQNNLPIGQLDFETLDVLGIVIKSTL